MKRSIQTFGKILKDMPGSQRVRKRKSFYRSAGLLSKFRITKTQSESDYWNVALAAEAKVRAYLVERKIRVVKAKRLRSLTDH